jgi:hypothetical protein
MQIAPAATPHTEAITTATTPIIRPFNTQITTVEDVAGIELGAGGVGREQIGRCAG